MKIKFKQLIPEAVLPAYANPGDAGLDLTATHLDITDNGKYGYYEYSTGISVEIPEGYVGLLFPRSSISKYGLILANSVGVIDSSYRGEIKLRFKYVAGTNAYEPKDKVGQLVIIPLPNIVPTWAEELTETVRNAGGFGSTGN